MKILFINAIYGSRSSGRCIADIKRLLDSAGHEVHVATPLHYPGPEFYRIGNSPDHKLHGLLSRLTGKQAYFSRRATRALLRHIDSIQPDLVHIQVIHGNYLNFPMVMNYLADRQIPTVFVLDDCWYFTGKCCHYTTEKCYKWKTQCSNCPRLHQDNPSLFFDRTRAIYADKKRLFSRLPRYAVVTVSDWLKSEAAQSFLKGAAVLRRIYNAVDVEQFQYRPDCGQLKAALHLESRKIILGVATAWKDHQGLSKGLKLFIRLAELLPQEYKIVLIGEPDESMVLPENILSIPFVAGAAELSRYYSMADVFVQMSSEETFGRVTAEALCCGTPVVVFDSTANPELVGPGCGMVVENQNTDAVFQAVMQITSAGRNSFSTACRKFAEQNFDSRQIVQQYLSLYRELLGK